MESTTTLSVKSQARKDRIIRFAEEKFFATGFHKISLEELVAGLRISKSTIYDYFGSKEGLIGALVNKLSEDLSSQLEEIVEAEDTSVPEKIIAVAVFQSEVVRRINHRFFHDLKVHTPELWEKFQAGRQERIDQYYTPMIERGLREGIFREGLSLEFLVQLYLKMTDVVCYTDLSEAADISRKKVLHQVMEVFLAGTMKPNQKPLL